jgi:hypothetical protein
MGTPLLSLPWSLSMPRAEIVTVLLRELDAHPEGIEYPQFRLFYEAAVKSPSDMTEVFLALSTRHLIGFEVPKLPSEGRALRVIITETGRRWLRDHPVEDL